MSQQDQEEQQASTTTTRLCDDVRAQGGTFGLSADPAQPQRAPGSPEGPDTIEAPRLPDPDAPDDVPVSGSVGVDAVEAHMGATEEDIGDRTGPGAGYDEGKTR